MGGPRGTRYDLRMTLSRRLVRNVAVFSLVVGCVGCDRVTKRVAVSLLPEGQRVSMLGDVVRLEHVRNQGAFLGAGAGLGAGIRWLAFTWGVGLLVVAALVAAFRSSGPRGAAGAALVAAGGLGNLWDRIATGGWVIDFMNLGVGPVRTGIFNVADVAIVVGVILLALREHPGEGARAGADAGGEQG